MEALAFNDVRGENMKKTLNDYNVAFIAEQEAEFRRIYDIPELTSRDCDYLWECESEEESREYLKKNYPSYF